MKKYLLIIVTLSIGFQPHSAQSSTTKDQFATAVAAYALIAGAPIIAIMFGSIIESLKSIEKSIGNNISKTICKWRYNGTFTGYRGTYKPFLILCQKFEIYCSNKTSNSKQELDKALSEFETVLNQFKFDKNIVDACSDYLVEALNDYHRKASQVIGLLKIIIQSPKVNNLTLVSIARDLSQVYSNPFIDELWYMKRDKIEKELNIRVNKLLNFNL